MWRIDLVDQNLKLFYSIFWYFISIIYLHIPKLQIDWKWGRGGNLVRKETLLLMGWVWNSVVSGLVIYSTGWSWGMQSIERILSTQQIIW